MNFKYSMNEKIKAFTLVEIFLVTALLGIVLMTIFSTYHSGIRIWKAVKELDLTKRSKFYISIEKIRREMMGYIRDFKDIDFEGGKEKLSFPTLSDLNIVKVTYVFNKSRGVLERKTIKFSDSLKDKMNEQTTELFDAQNVQFNYFFYDMKDMAGYWTSSVSGKDSGIPEAVKIDIERGNKKYSEYIFIPK